MNIKFPILCLLLPLITSAQELLIFGGFNHDDFLGCLKCNEYSSESICNEYGQFGNEYASGTMWNEYSSPYGNEYSSSSPWNKYSTSNSVPVLVDRNGQFYGYFTINDYRSDAVNFASDMKIWYEENDGDLEQVRIRLCNAFGYSG